VYSYFYHTARDALDSVSAGTLQHLGDNVVALVHAFMSTRVWTQPHSHSTHQRGVYYDVLGYWMISYDEQFAQRLNYSVLAIVLLLSSMWRAHVSIVRVVYLLLVQVLSIVVCTASALGTAKVLLTVAPSMAMSWFGRPLLAVLLYAVLPSCVYVLLLVAATRRNTSTKSYDEQYHDLVHQAAVCNVALWAMLVLLGTMFRIGSTCLGVWMLLSALLLALLLRTNNPPRIVATAVLLPSVVVVLVCDIHVLQHPACARSS
jgi:hypothetical protein